MKIQISCLSAQCDKSHCCPHEDVMQARVSQMRPMKILIRLCDGQTKLKFCCAPKSEDKFSDVKYRDQTWFFMH